MRYDDILDHLKRIEALVTDGNQKPLSTKEAAAYLGVSVSHLHRLSSKGEIPYFKSKGGKLSFFSVADLRAWMMAHRVPSNEEIEREALAYTPRR